MTSTLERLVRPADVSDYTSPSRPRRVGTALGVVGLVILAVTFILNLVAADRVGAGEDLRPLLAWSFGLTTLGLASLKTGIAIILYGIIQKLWVRAESIRVSLPKLVTRNVGSVERSGEVDTPYGPATVGTGLPEPLPVHRMAKVLWLPMLVMGVMAVVAGLVVTGVEAANYGVDDALARSLSAWRQGLQFLGEGFLLSAISFELGSILWAIRTAGAEVQAELGFPVKTLKMPTAAKAFIGLMAIGLMTEVAQFVLYVVAAGFDDPARFAVWAAWLGPLREFGLGVLLSGITLALVAIATALGFQFHRARELITGRA